jgi:hypothetical protein
MNKQEILNNLEELIAEEGCYGDAMLVINLGWSKYKGKIDEQLSALDLLVEDIITPEIDNELTPGHLNLLRFPRFRETIKKIATKMI